jgi:3-methyl-2-oxobutanoate hydroxymethyltransferase
MNAQNVNSNLMNNQTQPSEPATSVQRVKPKTLTTLQQAKANQLSISMVTAYDAGFARLAIEAGIDILLVGDSLGMVVQGDTLSVSMDEMVYHTQMVRRGTPTGLIMADLPFLSDTDIPTVLRNAGRLIQEGGADIVKIEATAAKADLVQAMTDAGIAVCAHIGLLPQKVRQLGGYRVRGRDVDDAAVVMRDAELLTHAGAAMVLVECVPSALGARITKSVDVPVIGIGAGVDVDGQVLVMNDLLGMNPHPARFVRDFLRGRGGILQALQAYADAVRSRSFPAEHEGFV